MKHRPKAGVENMKVLAFSDVHGDLGLIRRVREEARRVDVVVCCGDFSPYEGSKEDVAEAIGSLHENLLVVPGNFETPEEVEVLSGRYG